jgi:hypothetical protein
MRYEHPRLRVEVTFTLGTEHHFIEKRLTLSGDQAYGLRRVIVSRPQFAADKLAIIVPYRYQHNVTYIGRTEVGGFFVGEEVPFDTSLLDGDSVTLSYRPGLKVKAGEEVQCEPAYFGVYRRSGRGARAKGLSISPSVEGDLLNGSYHHLPLAEETEAMVAMVSAILGPPRHGPTSVLSPLCCGGVPLGPMDEKWFESDQQRARIKQILDFAAECGIEWVQDYLPWGGEYNKVRRLAAGERREFNDWMRDLLAYTKRVGLKPIIWSTMTNVQPWSGPKTRPAFRPDKPEWRAVGPAVMTDTEANCMGAEEYRQWLTAFVLDHMDRHGNQGFSIDGDFAGNGGWLTTSCVPLRCLSDRHDHLPGEAQYACQRGVARHLASVRAHHPKAFLWLMRPMMDLGVWTYRNGDAVFTILEDGRVENMTGIAGQPRNVTFGDKIRHWARLRRDLHFCPPYLDQVHLFAGVGGAGSHAFPWSGEKLDYVLLSAISTTANQCYFTGPIEEIPRRDRAEIRRWLDWSRAHSPCLLVRKDLPDWPAAGKVDGSAHVVGERGFVFLFNPNSRTLPGQFALTEESIGLKGAGPFQLTQEYPEPGRTSIARSGDTVRWEVPAQSTVLLRIRKTEAK